MDRLEFLKAQPWLDEVASDEWPAGGELFAGTCVLELVGDVGTSPLASFPIASFPIGSVSIPSGDAPIGGSGPTFHADGTSDRSTTHRPTSSATALGK